MTAAEKFLVDEEDTHPPIDEAPGTWVTIRSKGVSRAQTARHVLAWLVDAVLEAELRTSAFTLDCRRIGAAVPLAIHGQGPRRAGVKCTGFIGERLV